MVLGISLFTKCDKFHLLDAPPKPPVISLFNVNTRAVSSQGGDVMLSWDASHANKVELSVYPVQGILINNSNGNTATFKPTTSAAKVTFPVDSLGKIIKYTLTLSAVGSKNTKTVSDTLTVEQMAPHQALITYFKANPDSISYQGKKITLSWSAKNATSYSINSSPVLNGLPYTTSDTTDTSTTVSIPANPNTNQKNYLFTLTAKGAPGVSDSKQQVTVKEDAVPGSQQITSFTANPDTLPSSGGNVTLSWSGKNVSSYTLNSIPSITGFPNSTTNTSESVSIPSNNTDSTITYKILLQGNGSNGSSIVKDSLTIVEGSNVQKSDLEVTNFTFMPTTINPGDHPGSVSYKLKNNGPSSLTSPNTRVNADFYLSKNKTFGDQDDIKIGNNGYDFNLQSSTSQAVTLSTTGLSYITIPKNISGDYYVFVYVNHASPSVLIDPDTTNNYVMRSGQIQISGPEIKSFNANPDTLSSTGGNVLLSWSAKNASNYKITSSPVLSNTPIITSDTSTTISVPSNSTNSIETYKFKLIASNNNGNSVGDSVLVKVNFSTKKVYKVSGKVTTNNSGLSNVNIIAIPNTGNNDTTTTDLTGDYNFVFQKDGGYTITPKRKGYEFNPQSQSITLNDNISDITGVNFSSSLISYTLSIQSDGNGYVNPSGNKTVKFGIATSISATPKTGYHFTNWSVVSGSGVNIGDTHSATTTVTLTNGNATIKANFVEDNYTLTIQSDGNGYVNPFGDQTVKYGTATNISATPKTGYHFTNWSVVSGAGVNIGDTHSATTTVTLTNGNATIKANFAKNNYTLTVQSDGNGSVSPSGNQIVKYATATNIDATPKTGYKFKDWTVVSGTGVTFGNTPSANTTVTLNNGNAAIKANFTKELPDLSVDIYNRDNNGGVISANGTSIKVILYKNSWQGTTTSHITNSGHADFYNLAQNDSYYLEIYNNNNGDYWGYTQKSVQIPKSLALYRMEPEVLGNGVQINKPFLGVGGSLKITVTNYDYDRSVNVELILDDGSGNKVFSSTKNATVTGGGSYTYSFSCKPKSGYKYKFIVKTSVNGRFISTDSDHWNWTTIN